MPQDHLNGLQDSELRQELLEELRRLFIHNYHVMGRRPLTDFELHQHLLHVKAIEVTLTGPNATQRVIALQFYPHRHSGGDVNIEKKILKLYDTAAAVGAGDLFVDYIDGQKQSHYRVFRFCKPDTRYVDARLFGEALLRKAGITSAIFKPERDMPNTDGLELPFTSSKSSERKKSSTFLMVEGSGDARRLKPITVEQALPMLKNIAAEPLPDISVFDIEIEEEEAKPPEDDLETLEKKVRAKSTYQTIAGQAEYDSIAKYYLQDSDKYWEGYAGLTCHRCEHRNGSRVPCPACREQHAHGMVHRRDEKGEPLMNPKTQDSNSYNHNIGDYTRKGVSDCWWLCVDCWKKDHQKEVG